MTLDSKYEFKHEAMLRDARPWSERFAGAAKDPTTAAMVFSMAAVAIYTEPYSSLLADLIFFVLAWYFYWLLSRPLVLPFKLPKSAGVKDPNYKRPDGSIGMADGILYLGNDSKSGEEVWFNNNDARTHCLYLGTTGSGKTFGLKSFSCNALCWSSGYIFIDGKADTDLWSTLSALARRFGRDDDLLIMNYMTGNVGGRVPSNTLNPFSSGSASYLTNMLVSLMPDGEGDNAMWKDRAVSLISAIMPCLVWKRENQNIPLSIGVVRNYLNFKDVIKLSRVAAIPEHLRSGLRAYLNELPGYVDSVFDDDGNEKASPDGAAVDTSVPRQQHGYLSMQFTRSMSSLGDDYGFIFDTQAADIDMVDVVLNRRILVVLIPALEKSGDETANLGKIISSTLKGMMGATLGSTIEGDTATAIENKPTTSSTPFMAIFDEVGYYTAQGMAVMAAQARSLGFSLVFAAQDMPALEKRVKEEARSITANCNIKIFGKLEDPTQTKEFFEKTVGSSLVTEVSGFERDKTGGVGYIGSQNASVQVRARASYDGLKGFNEGKAICAFGKGVKEIQFYNSDIGHAKAMRVHRFLPIPPPSEEALQSLHQIDGVLKRFRNPKWDPAQVELTTAGDITAMARGFSEAKKSGITFVEAGAIAVASVAEAHDTIKPGDTGDDPAPEGVTPPASSATTSAGMRRAPLISEGEKSAADMIAKAGGPLSWLEVIGGATAPAAAAAEKPSNPFSADPPMIDVPESKSPVVAPEDAEAAKKVDQVMSWGDIIGATKAPSAKTTVESGAKDPLDWTSILGADDKDDTK